jgi:hypothetical protein
MKKLLSITLLGLSLTMSAQTVFDLGPDGLPTKEFLVKQKMNNLAIKAKERLARGKSINESQQEALAWDEARNNKRKSDSIKESERVLAIKYAQEEEKRQEAEKIRIIEENEKLRKENERTYYKFATSYIENYKIKYRDYVIKSYRENRNNWARKINADDISTELTNEYKKVYNTYPPNYGYDTWGNINDAMREVEKEFENSNEYIDGKAVKESRLKAQLAELNKAQKEYNYNMTHLEKYTTPQLREMYIYFKDKKSSQMEAELVRVELLRRK